MCMCQNPGIEYGATCSLPLNQNLERCSTFFCVKYGVMDVHFVYDKFLTGLILFYLLKLFLFCFFYFKLRGAAQDAGEVDLENKFGLVQVL